ncbi:hypothetical protein JCM39194_10930 [Desulfotomaculum varum]
MAKNSEKFITNNSTTNNIVVKYVYITTDSVEMTKIGGGR